VVYFTYGLWHSKLGKNGVARFEAEVATMGTHPPVE